ncbi:LysR family transcriptional regulator [Chitinimonas arctica]|uniref:LysR family transcriptional regulator n=1 Tax=Chitinimonas arctica TaxID=2594795 RepID=A0A516SMB2_9NEIS|nr:LysR family transcriptional regulator [Chitinimonas arctica]
MDLLIGFEAAARQLSFSKAGEEVFLTQSAVSRQVKKLEEHLNIVLFERRHRALELTDQGRVLYEAVCETLDRLSTTVDALRRDESRRGLKVSSTTSFASLWLVPRLERFRARYPEINLHIEADNRLVDLSQGVIDLAIRYTSKELAPTESTIHLCDERLFPVCSPALLRRNGREMNSVADLANHTLLHLSDPQNLWPWLQWSTWLEGAGAAHVAGQVDLRFSHYDQMIQGAIFGHGVALGSSPLVDPLLEEGVLVAPLREQLSSPRAFFLCLGNRRDPAVDAFVSWISDAIIANDATRQAD